MTREEREAVMGVINAWEVVSGAFASKLPAERVARHLSRALFVLEQRIGKLARFLISEAPAPSPEPSPEAKRLVVAVLKEALAAGHVVDANGIRYCDANYVRDWVEMALVAAELGPGVPLPPARPPLNGR